MKRRALSLFLLSLLAAAGARATTFVMVRDEALVDQAQLIVEGRLLSRGPAAGGSAATEYVFAVERVVKGTPEGDQVVVRVLGAIRPDGRSLKIWGAPAFREDERALLFLVPHADNTYSVLHLALGAFHVVDVEGRPAAVRDLRGMQQVRVTPAGVEGVPAAPERARDLERFARWVDDRVAGRLRTADYFVDLPEAELEHLTEEFTLFEFGGKNFRWFQFDSGGSVTFKADNAGQDGVSGGGFTQVQSGLNVWNADAATNVNYVYGGKTGAGTGFLCSDPPTPAEPCGDGINMIHFNDPNDELDPFSCASGGVLAIGGPWFNPGITGVFKSKTYIKIQEADIITNSGLSCFFADSPSPLKAAEELFGHELGHTLGLGHSCDEDGDTVEPTCAGHPSLEDALMKWLVHDDGRGAALKADDRAALAVLYAPVAPTVPAAPSNLEAEGASTTDVALAWQDNSTNETEFRIELQAPGGSFTDVGGVPANTTAATVNGLAPATVYGFRVRAKNSAGSSAPSNTAFASTFAAPAPCIAGATALCLNNDRFEVQAIFDTSGGASGTAQVVELTPETGYLWFFSATNVEAVVKVINACSFNNRYWFFAGGLTDVHVIITVTDTPTGVVKTYVNPQGTPFQPIQDTSAFATCP